MPKLWRPLVVALLVCVALSVRADDTLQVTVTGAVMHAGEQTLTAGTRLVTPLLDAGLKDDAYPLGGSWERVQLEAEQTRLKTGVLFDLHTLSKLARLRSQPPLFAVANRLLQQLGAMPVTGRQVETLLDPRPLEVSKRNPRLGAGDRVFIPLRPATVLVLGAVESSCQLPFAPQQSALDYLKQCAPAKVADNSWLYVIQPDGTVSHEGVGAWNRDVLPPLAPGAIVYVPVAKKWLSSALRDDFNQEVVQFLATQRVPLVLDSEASHGN